MLHRLATADDNQAVRRLAIVACENGSAHRDTIVLLEGLGEDDELERELRETAAKVAAGLKKKSRLEAGAGLLLASAGRADAPLAPPLEHVA